MSIYVAIDAQGREHVFQNWLDCQSFVHGKPYLSCKAPSIEAARIRLSRLASGHMARTATPVANLSKGAPLKAAARGKSPKNSKNSSAKPTVGLCSDAGTHGNPGPCECKVTDMTGRVLRHVHLGHGTNNFAELSGILESVQIAKDMHIPMVWTDSKVCLQWIHSGKIGGKVAQRERIIDLVMQIREVIRQTGIRLRQWNTKAWGEIPADFGRKRRRKNKIPLPQHPNVSA